jgi:hypothetical protein
VTRKLYVLAHEPNIGGTVLVPKTDAGNGVPVALVRDSLTKHDCIALWEKRRLFLYDPRTGSRKLLHKADGFIPKARAFATIQKWFTEPGQVTQVGPEELIPGSKP